jgi:hypothetical protein
MHEFPSTVCANGRRIFGWSALTLFPAFQVGPMRTRSKAPDAWKRTFIAFIRINVFARLLALQAAPSIPGDVVEGEVAAVGSGIRLGWARCVLSPLAVNPSRTTMICRELLLENDNAPHGMQLGLFASKSLVCSEDRQALPVYRFCGLPLDNSDLAQLFKTMRVWSAISARVPLSDRDRPAWLFGPAAPVDVSLHVFFGHHCRYDTPHSAACYTVLSRHSSTKRCNERGYAGRTTILSYSGSEHCRWSWVVVELWISTAIRADRRNNNASISMMSFLKSWLYTIS